MPWTGVTRSHPCPICNRPDWCRVSGTAVHCHRVESSKPWTGPTAGGWIHELGGQPQPVPKSKLQKKRLRPAELRQMAVEAFRAEKAGEMRQWLSEVLGVPVAVLIEFGVGWGWDGHREQDFSTWPEKDAWGGIVGIRRRYRSGHKRSTQGGSVGVYYGNRWGRAPGPILVPEGGSDTAALHARGHCAVGRPSCSDPRYLAELLHWADRRDIIVLGENDRKPPGRHPSCGPDCECCMMCWPGKAGAIAVARTLAQQLGRRIDWAIPNGKDARAFFQEFPHARTQDLTDEFEEVGYEVGSR